jgi:tRNA A-37 threonylcarbamoyl transferase component Bud32
MTLSTDLIAWSTLSVGEIPHSLVVENKTLHHLKSVRSIPRRRLVLHGVWQEVEVYAKFFLGLDAKKYAQRDKCGRDLLQQAHIATPTLLYAGAVAEDVEVLIFQAVASSINTQEAYRLATDQAARRDLVMRLVQTVAQHHKTGLLQTDLHLKNFLVITDRPIIYTLDGDGICAISPWLKKSQQLHNLATLFSKMDVLDDIWIAYLYQTYCKEMGVEYYVENASQVRGLTQKIRRQVASAYADKKVFRTCSDVKVIRSFKYFIAIANDFLVERPLLLSLDQFLTDKSKNIKNGNTCTIAQAGMAGLHVVVKRYNIKNLWHGLSRAVRPSRAAKSWANAHRLRISNISTAKPLALVEERFGYFRHRAYYISEYIDAPDVMQFFAQSVRLEDRQTVAHNLATLFYKLYLLKFSHGDCKASNIKIVNFAPVLIDLDGMQAHFGSVVGDWWFERKHIKDLKRLMKNWENDAEVTILLKRALLSEYIAQRPDEGKHILFRAAIV